MAPRPRKNGRKDLPHNLYQSTKAGKIYFQYRDPRTGKFHGLGTDKQQAIHDAHALNSVVYDVIRQAKLRGITATPGMRFSHWLAKYMAICNGKNLAENTLRTKKTIIKRWQAELGDKPISTISVLDIASVLNKIRDQGKDRMAQAMRSGAIDIFKDAIAEGITDDNPAAKTRNPTVAVKRARLTLEEFNTIYAAAGQLDAWVQNAMMLAIVTGQRRDDICNMKFGDVKDGMLHIIQSKTGTKLRIDTRLKLTAVDMTIADVVKQCRDNIVSQHMIHHTNPHGNCKIGDIIWRDTVTKGFARARALTNLTWDAQPPTFHEIRSLSERLYKQQGVDTQTLLGHKEQKTTDTYHDARGYDWTEIRV